MPELPEVETVANGVHERVHGRRILSVWTSGKPQTFKSPETEIAATLTGATIDSVRRVGKTIVMTVNRSASPQAEFLIHLGMTGRLLVSPPDVPLPPHTHAVLSLGGAPGKTAHRELRFVDPRRFGRLSIHQANASQPATDNLQPASPYTGPGREPLSISLEDFIALFRGRKTPIKAALLNQSLLHGVGNIYADESLFRAGIHPLRPAGRLSAGQYAALREAVIGALLAGIDARGATIDDYRHLDGVEGSFQDQFLVYGRAGEPCVRCAGTIVKMVVAGRGTYVCERCQPRPRRRRGAGRG